LPAAQNADGNRFLIGPDLAGLPDVPANRLSVAVLIGRSLALCAHPYAAWRTYSTRGRLAVLCAYVAASYAVMLGALFVLLDGAR
jgi:hypothetical protein